MAEGKHSVGEDSGHEREEPEEEAVQHGHQQVSEFGLRGRDRVQHGVDHHRGVLEPRLARQHEVLAGQLEVLPVEDLLALLVQFLPDIQARLHPQDVGGLAKVARLDDADLRGKNITI